MGPTSFQIRIKGAKILFAPIKTDLPYNFCFINFLPSLTVEAVDALQTLFRASLTPGVHPGGQNIAYDLALVKLGPIPNLVRIGPTVCISILDTQTHTDSPLYIRYIIYPCYKAKPP
jgi:hypothetical protein